MMDFLRPDVDDWDEDFDAELTQETLVYCPYCGQGVDVGIDHGGGGGVQDYVEDCGVCCQPMAVRVSFDRDGQPFVSVTTLDDE